MMILTKAIPVLIAKSRVTFPKQWPKWWHVPSDWGK